MKRIKTIKTKICVIIMMLSIFISANAMMMVSAQESPDEIIHPVYYKIYDKDGNLKSEGELPSNEEEVAEEMKNRAYVLDERTLNNGEVMQLFSSANSGFYVAKGDYLRMSFQLNRNAYIYSGIGEWNGVQTVVVDSGLTGGRIQSGCAPSGGYYYGYIRNTSTESVKIQYASFSTPYL